MEREGGKISVFMGRGEEEEEKLEVKIIDVCRLLGSRGVVLDCRGDLVV
jgi:hypothetical protein